MEGRRLMIKALDKYFYVVICLYFDIPFFVLAMDTREICLISDFGKRLLVLCILLCGEKKKKEESALIYCDLLDGQDELERMTLLSLNGIFECVC